MGCFRPKSVSGVVRAAPAYVKKEHHSAEERLKSANGKKRVADFFDFEEVDMSGLDDCPHYIASARRVVTQDE